MLGRKLSAYNANAETGIRDENQLKTLYRNIKRTTKKAVAEENVRSTSFQIKNPPLPIFLPTAPSKIKTLFYYNGSPLLTSLKKRK